MSLSYNGSRFHNQVSSAMTRIKQILENTRNPQLAENVGHSWQDKYSLADYLANSALRAILDCLDLIEIDVTTSKKLKDWSKEKSVSLRLRGEETCEFIKETTREVETVTNVSERSGILGKSTRTDKVITKITEYFWKFSVHYELIVFEGTNIKDSIILRSRDGTCELMTTSNVTPKPKVSVIPNIDVNITWLLQQLNDNLVFCLSIDRDSKSCHTPRRNEQTDAAVDFCTKFYHWSENVENYFRNRLFPVQPHHGLHMGSLNSSGVFVPVVPLFEKQYGKATDAGEGSSLVLPEKDVSAFMREQKNSLQARLGSLKQTFPNSTSLITSNEASIILCMCHCKAICQYYIDGVQYIEEIIRNQLLSAIGKVVTPADLIEYMEYHNRKVFKPEYAPRLLSYAIRRPDHYPEGILSIEAPSGLPIPTISHKIEGNHPMNFSINAATKIQFNGARYVHAWVNHKFSGDSGISLKLTARARQFSSFIIIIGNIISATSFNPKHAMIIQNKDDLLIPLLLEEIPTPKAFRDAIESLSPEQQRFAKAFRSMQLESSLFGVCIIQIKPQLEKVLNLPQDSLTKEIQLSQDLMKLFIEYQVPSDLLSYEGDDFVRNDKIFLNNSSISDSKKVEVVQDHVAEMLGLIQACKDKELEEQRMKAEYERQQRLQQEQLKRKEKDSIQPLSSMSTLQSARPQLHMAKRRNVRSAAPVQCRSMAAPVACAAAPVLSRSRAAVPSSAPAPMKPSPVPSSAPAPVPSSNSAPVPSKPVAKPVEPAKPVEQPSSESKPEEKVNDKNYESGQSDESVLDFTKIPTKLDQQFEKLDTDAAVHATIIKTGKSWTKKYQKTLLGNVLSSTLDVDKQKEERNEAFDLLDALTRSGVLDVDEAEFHVVLAATHSFDKTLTETLVQDNMNPIEKIERSMLIIASTLHNVPPEELLKEEYVDLVKSVTPNIFE